MNFVEAMTAAQAGYDTWAAKPHNKKWAKMVYHTPIPNDLLVNIAEAFCRASTSSVAPVAVSVKTLRWEKYPVEGRLTEGQNQQREFISRALTPWGSAIFLMLKDGVYSFSGWDALPGAYADEEAAKAFAQTIFDRSILSSITPASKGGEKVVAALRKAEQFIVNGVDLGFIRMPDPGMPDPAHDTLPAIRAALAALSAQDTDGVAKREAAWLIERNNGDQPWSWYAENSTGWHWWTTVAHEAKKFASKALAEAHPAYQMIASDPAIGVTEHVFLGANP